MKKIMKTITSCHADDHFRSACIASDSIGNKWVFSGYGKTREISEKDAEDKFRTDEKEWSTIDRAKVISLARG